MKKKIITLIIAAALTASLSMPVFAGTWQQDSNGWWYQEDRGSYPTNQWKEIDGKQYYFDGNGYMLSNTTTPDGFVVDASGAWTVNGVVQTQGAANNAGTNTGAETGYDAYGISNAAIDMLESTKEENAAKYGAVSEYEMSGDLYVNYANGFTMEYYKGISNRLTTQKPSMMLKGIDDEISEASVAEANLKANGYTDTYCNEVNAITKVKGYQLIWRPSGPLIEIVKINK